MILLKKGCQGSGAPVSGPVFDRYYDMSERQACAMLNMSRSVYQYKAKPSDEDDLLEKLSNLTARKPRWDFKKCTPVVIIKDTVGITSGFDDYIDL